MMLIGALAGSYIDFTSYMLTNVLAHAAKKDSGQYQRESPSHNLLSIQQETISCCT